MKIGTRLVGVMEASLVSGKGGQPISFKVNRHKGCEQPDTQSRRNQLHRPYFVALDSTQKCNPKYFIFETQPFSPESSLTIDQTFTQLLCYHAFATTPYILGAIQSVISLQTHTSLGCGSTQKKPMHSKGKHANSTCTALSQDQSLVSCVEAVELYHRAILTPILKLSNCIRFQEVEALPWMQDAAWRVQIARLG